MSNKNEFKHAKYVKSMGIQLICSFWPMEYIQRKEQVLLNVINNFVNNEDCFNNIQHSTSQNTLGVLLKGFKLKIA